MKTLEEVLEEYYKHHPENRSVQHWAGCNYYVNQGKHEMEPAGTAQSMHDCEEWCKHFSVCELKQSTPIWEHNEEKELYLRKKFREMVGTANE